MLAPGGRLLAMAVSRFASLLDGLYADWLDDPVFRPIVDQDLKLASGDLVQIVEVARDLAEREASRGRSAGEKRMLAKARLMLLQEG